MYWAVELCFGILRLFRRYRSLVELRDLDTGTFIESRADDE